MHRLHIYATYIHRLYFTLHQLCIRFILTTHVVNFGDMSRSNWRVSSHRPCFGNAWKKLLAGFSRISVYYVGDILTVGPCRPLGPFFAARFLMSCSEDSRQIKSACRQNSPHRKQRALLKTPSMSGYKRKS